MVYREMLSSIIAEMEERKRILEYELEKAPDGSLNMRERDGNHYFSIRLPKGGNRKKVKRSGITGDSKLIGALFRKKYLVRAIKLINEDIEVLNTALDKFKETDELSAMKEELEIFPELADCLYKDGQSDEEWAGDYKPQQDFYNEGLRSSDADGTDMRSKGEIIIASRLDKYKIPYRYEDKIDHPDTDRVPDFKIRRPKDGKIIYWEHLGEKDREYFMRNELKFIEYKNIDIVPWDNLIITYDNAKGGIDVKIIDAMIEGWLL